MSLKRDFTEEEARGLTQEELKIARRYLRKHKTAGQIPKEEAHKLHELFMVGSSFKELHDQFPEYELPRIILTACLQKWMIDRDKLMWTVQDRIKARVLKSFIGQVDFLTTLLEVNNTETLLQMRKYILDPINEKKPDLRITSLKEYQIITDILSKLSGPNTNLWNKPEVKPKEKPKLKSAAELLEAEVINGESEEE